MFKFDGISNTEFLSLQMTYLSACIGWLLLIHVWPGVWGQMSIDVPRRRFLDLILALLTLAMILLFRELFSGREIFYEISSSLYYPFSRIVYNLLLIFPILFVLLLRKQSFVTIFLSRKAFLKKIVIGLSLGIVSTAIFFTLKNKIELWRFVLLNALDLDNLIDLITIICMLIILAYMILRLKWTMGSRWSIVILAPWFPLILIPAQVVDGWFIWEIIASFIISIFLMIFVLYVIQKSQDIIWLALTCYIINIADKTI